MSHFLFYQIVLVVFAILPIFVLLGLIIGKITAPYGKMTSNKWGNWMVSSKLGWLLMESPSSLIFLFYLINHFLELTTVQIVFFVIWQSHYFYRSFIYSLRSKHSKPMPVALLLSAFSFQLVNTYLQASWIFNFAPKDLYTGNYFISVPFILGLFVFILGTYINRKSDNILRNLRSEGETEYKIPYGFLYKWVSCPNYLGEIIIWLGWAIMLKSLVGYVFCFWTIANLLPRALSTHQWYLNKFSDYPEDRKALIPYIL